jgi:hypothetical protein
MPAFTNGAGGRNPQAGSGFGDAEQPRGTTGDRAAEAERTLLDAALEFYGAAGAVIDYAGPDRPRVRHDAAGLGQVRDAMTALEAQVRRAHAAGLPRDRIARVARLEEEIVELILAGGDAEPLAGGDAEPAGA